MSKAKKALVSASDFTLLEKENVRLRTAIMRIIGWLERLATQADAQEKQNRGQFTSLADACAADAKNYRMTADNLRRTLAE